MSVQSAQPLARVLLLRAHRHGGRDFPPGAQLELPRAKALWLQAQGVAQPAPDAPAPGAKPDAKPGKE